MAAALILLTTALKLAVVLAPRADLYGAVHSPGELGATVLGEEYHRGNIAQELLEGPLLPVPEYQYTPWLGGSLVVGLAAAPSFALLGPNVVALKLVPIAFNALAVAFLFLVLDRFVGRRAAWAGGLLMALAPPGYTMLSVVAWGSHVENNAWTLAALYLFLVLGWGGGSTGPRALLLGLVCGFATWFAYLVFIAWAVFAAFSLVLDRALFLRREFWIAVAGFVLGFAPWIAWNVRHDFEGLRVYDRALHEAVDLDEGGILERARIVATQGVPTSLGFEQRHSAAAGALRALYALPLAALVALALFRARRGFLAAAAALFARDPEARAAHLARVEPRHVFLAYPFAFLAAFSLCDTVLASGESSVQEARYALVLHPFLFLAAGCGYDALRSARALLPGGLLAGGLLALALAASLAGNLALLDPSRLGTSWRAPAHSYVALGRFLALAEVDDLERYDLVLERLATRRSPERREQLLYAMGRSLKNYYARAERGGHMPDETLTAESLGRALDHLRARAPADCRPYFERPYPGEQPYDWTRREHFWSDYRGRHSAGGR